MLQPEPFSSSRFYRTTTNPLFCRTSAKKSATPVTIAVVMFDFPLPPLELGEVVVTDVATTPGPPRELIVEVVIEMEEVGMYEVVALDEWAVEPDVVVFCCWG